MAVPAMDRESGINGLNRALLYGILDMGYVEETKVENVALQLLEAGVGILQLRAKAYDPPSVMKLLQDTAPRLVAMCRSHDVPFIVNDFPEVALAVGADGVHIGQDDGSLDEVRAIVGEDMLVGRSTHSPGQANAALKEGFDYIGFGPLFPTPTKLGRAGIGIENIAGVEKDVGSHIPVFCIGGIKPDNLDTVIAAGARRVVVVSSLLQSEDISAATRAVVKKLNA